MDCMRNSFYEGVLLDRRFRTVAPLNHGSFGMVFKALDTWTGEFVALKCLTKPSASGYSSALAIDDRSEELEIHRRIGEHANIINLITHFETEHHIFLVIEFCANGDLYEAIRIGRGPGETEHVRECMLQLVDAVEHMHSKGVYHRDIKPENILLDKDGVMKLGDFGLATTDTWSFEGAVGSDRYMAPEQFEPANTGYSPAKADTWAIGICMLNILFSRNPFATPSLSDPLFSDFYNDRQTLFDVFPNMSQDTYEVLVHSLAIDPAKRSLSAVKEALVRAITFTTDDESLDDFCAEDTVVVTASAHREPLRTPSISTPHLDQNGAFPWARALAMSPPLRQLSAIPDTELSEPFPSAVPEQSSRDWYAVKPDNASLVSFVDSGLGVSFKSTNMELKSDAFKFVRSKPVAISGSLPVSMARPIPSMASVFSKKRDLVSKSWSDLWDEEEEENAGHVELENDMSIRGRSQEWQEESDGRDTPRVGLTEMKNPASISNSRNRTPEAARACEDDVSEHTGFIFEDDMPTLPATPVTPGNSRYSPPSKRSLLDKWAMLGERRRHYPTPSKTPGAQSISAPARKRSRAGSWRARNIDLNKQASVSSHLEHYGVPEQVQRHHSDKKDGPKMSGPWSASKDWRQHASPQQDDDVHDIEWVWRHDLHL